MAWRPGIKWLLSQVPARRLNSIFQISDVSCSDLLEDVRFPGRDAGMEEIEITSLVCLSDVAGE